MKQPIYIRVEPDLKKWLEDRSVTTRRTVSDYVRIVLQDHRADVYEYERQTKNNKQKGE